MEAEERELEAISTLRPPSEGSRRSSSASRRSNSLRQPSPQQPSNVASNTSVNSDACYVDIPASGIPVIELDEVPEPDSPDSRRCSARMISMNLQHTLRQLRKEEHNARVSSLLKRNAIFYRRQRCCECITMLSVLLIFTLFSLYIVFAHGFHFGESKPFNLHSNKSLKIVKQEGDSVDLMCQADKYWEWCRWIHMDKFCDYEWTPAYGVHQIGCDFPDGKVELIGDYDKHQCGVRVYNLDARDRGTWMCEVEKYYIGFSRRYGEYRTNVLNLVVHLKPTTTTSIPASPWSSAASATGDPTASALTPHSKFDPSNAPTKPSQNTTTMDPLWEQKEYERQFFLLRVFVLGTIGCVLSTLALMFWIYFMYLWRTWDSGKRPESSQKSSEAQAVLMGEDGTSSFGQRKSLCSSDENDNDNDDDDCNEENSDGTHPHFDRALRRSRRKSVSFAVCKVNKDTMQFDIEHKSVLLGNLSQPTSSTSPSANIKPPSSPLSEVAKKWKDAKNKLVPKDKSKLFSNVISLRGGGSGSGNDSFEFTDESFRNRRNELMEKAKLLEQAEQKAKASKSEKTATEKTTLEVNDNNQGENNEDETAI